VRIESTVTPGKFLTSLMTSLITLISINGPERAF